jgi:hypothetical protein
MSGVWALMFWVLGARTTTFAAETLFRYGSELRVRETCAAMVA